MKKLDLLLELTDVERLLQYRTLSAAKVNLAKGESRSGEEIAKDKLRRLIDALTTIDE